MAIWIEKGKHRARSTNHEKKVITRTFKTRREAEEWLIKFKQETAELRGYAKRESSTELGAEYNESIRKGDSVGYVLKKAMELDWPDKPIMVERGIRACKMLGLNTSITDITIDTLDDVVAVLRQEGKTNGTIRTYLSPLKVVLTRAQRLRLIYELPLFPEGRTLKRAEPRDLVLQDDWYEHFLLCHKVPEFKLLTQFLYEIGCRVGEAQALPWERISLSSGRIQFIKTKIARARSLPISDNVESILMECKRLRPMENPLYPVYKTYYAHYKRYVKETCQYFKLGPVIQREWLIHTLRHTKLTRLANQGANAIQIQYWAGHRSLQTSQGYIHSSGIDLECLINLEGRQQVLNEGIRGRIN